MDTQNPTGYAQVISETFSGGGANRELSHAYVYGLERISQFRSFLANNQSQTQTSYYAYDGHGSTRALTSATGAITDTYDYDAFGNLLHSTGTTFNEFLFAGEQFDSDLGLYYNRARYLNVSTARFWTMDTYEGASGDPLSLHKYVFAVGDPLDNMDPTGHESLAELTFASAVTTALAATLTTTLALTSAAMHGWHPSFGILSLSVNGGSSGYLGEVGVDVLFNASEVDVFLVGGFGVSPLTLFNRFDLGQGNALGKIQGSWSIGVVIGLENAEEYQEVETTATWPIEVINLIPGALFKQNKAWGLLTQLAKKEHNLLFSDLIARVGLGQSGSSMFAVGFNGNDFNWSVGGHIGPLFHQDIPEGLTRLLDEYSFPSLWAEIVAGIE